MNIINDRLKERNALFLIVNPNPESSGGDLSEVSKSEQALSFSADPK